jgi:protein TonB
LEEKPEESDYLAAYDRVVPEETRAERFRVNPEILSPEWSDEDEQKEEQAEPSDVEEPADGAVSGTERFDPDRDGRMASVKATWDWTNRVGESAPTDGSLSTSALKGAPQNDRLFEKRSDRTELNTKEYLYAGYLARVRRLVNFYWQQHIDSLPRTVRLSRPAYTTQVNAILDGQGSLEHVEVTASSSSKELDACVVRAFRVAGPYPNPPEGLVEVDGRVYLPTMGFTVQLGVAKAKYQGVDPRAGVQFPGILKSPR